MKCASTQTIVIMRCALIVHKLLRIFFFPLMTFCFFFSKVMIALIMILCSRTNVICEEFVIIKLRTHILEMRRTNAKKKRETSTNDDERKKTHAEMFSSQCKLCNVKHNNVISNKSKTRSCIYLHDACVDVVCVSVCSTCNN